MTDVPRCDRCNRKLKDPDSLSRGMGKTCYRKHQAYVEKFCISLFDADKKPKPQRQRKKREVPHERLPVEGGT